ncbi:hypothetical protein RJ640_022833 [Escallonia rubra]|uniref:Uncharacterized protein n=1 Tax=Escallonia rubra TaxID=112253 RepID=A0AA88R615_9ASTE|nr:hypothetical protein RJ640_022833 [Escallonia rubra]
MKDKQVVTETPMRSEEEDGVIQPEFTLRFTTRNASSKYDFVKVKVWLGDNADHYYVLSRFLLSRMLTVTKIPNHVALKIALELKKLLIDNSLLDVSQSDLEANLFKLMERRGYGQEYINRYKMMTRQISPSKSSIGNSCMWYCLCWEVYNCYPTCAEAKLAKCLAGLGGDLKKAMKDGKPIIIEGMHLDPSIYLMDDENKIPANMPEKVEEAKSLKISDKSATKVQIDSTACGSFSKNSASGNAKPEEIVSSGMLDKVLDGLKSIDIVDGVSENKGEATKGPEPNRTPLRKEKSGAVEPIIVPIVLKMAEFDHKALLEEWISTRTFSDKFPVQDKDKLVSNLKTIQDYLCSFKSQCIEQGLSSVSTASGGQEAET